MVEGGWVTWATWVEWGIMHHLMVEWVWVVDMEVDMEVEEVHQTGVVDLVVEVEDLVEEVEDLVEEVGGLVEEEGLELSEFQVRVETMN